MFSQKFASAFKHLSIHDGARSDFIIYRYFTDVRKDFVREVTHNLDRYLTTYVSIHIRSLTKFCDWLYTQGLHTLNIFYDKATSLVPLACFAKLRKDHCCLLVLKIDYVKKEHSNTDEI